MSAARWSTIMVFLGLALSSGRAVAQHSESLRTLIADRQCALSAALQAVYERPSGSTDSERFFVLAVSKNPRAYVRCRFGEDDRKIHCGASQAYYEEGNPHPRYVFMPRERMAALERLGFINSGPAADLTYTRDLAVRPNFDATAIFILTALHDGFGVRAETELDVTAPFTGSLVTACAR